MTVLDVLRFLLGLACGALILGSATAIAVRMRARRVVGDVIEASLFPPVGRVVGIALVALAGLALLGIDSIEPLLAGGALVLAAVFLAVRPGWNDRVMGTEGVRRGWFVRGFGDLEEWRMTGEHLRFRLRGRWEAVPLSNANQPAIAERLRALIPDRESEFTT